MEKEEIIKQFKFKTNLSTGDPNEPITVKEYNKLKDATLNALKQIMEMIE